MPPIPKRKPSLPTVKPQSEQTTADRLALNLEDLDRIAESLRGPLLAGRLNLGEYVRIADEAAVPLMPALLESAMLCDVIRSFNRKVGEPVCRCYVNKGKGWNPLPSHAILAVPGYNGKLVPNPEWFTTTTMLVAPTVKPMI